MSDTTAEERPAPQPPAPDTGATVVEPGATGRFWSTRRRPSAVVALLLLAASVLLLSDLAAVRAGRPALHVRRTLAQELAERPLDDVWVLVGAGVAAALGLWLLVLALTPGVRGILPMRRATPDVRAGLDRKAAAMVLRDRALEVPGVRSVRVRMRRRKADVRVAAHFREIDEVDADVRHRLEEAVSGLGLSRPPSLTVRVRRPERRKG
ncbi:DUF6286 domain-containing protein [Streptomyces abyssomicinicus]|uniref:DUF6286 domain-containing protein n=1 Tax=Streptomyces abyssomicinicus TaxID=574929 RepID=UPI0015814253|nr:DUF6286 domain-containing protein [Streptomyces abyssomicinicus]